VDEFHIGGREATQDFLKQLDICKGHKVLDIGCGIGGPSRFVASHFDGNFPSHLISPDAGVSIISKNRVFYKG